MGQFRQRVEMRNVGGDAGNAGVIGNACQLAIALGQTPFAWCVRNWRLRKLLISTGICLDCGAAVPQGLAPRRVHAPSARSELMSSISAQPPVSLDASAANPIN